MKSLKLSLLALAIFSTPLHADRELKCDPEQKREVRNSMIGFRSTLIFYTFKDQQAVMVVLIDNKDETFPVTAKVHLFDEGTTEEGLKKWINNQHSDGLFPDVPSPTFTAELPKEVARVTSHKEAGTSKNPGPRPGVYKNYEVQLFIDDHEVDGKFKLAAHKDMARVHVPSK